MKLTENDAKAVVEGVIKALYEADFLLWHPSDRAADILEILLTWNKEAALSDMISVLRNNGFVVAGPSKAEESE